MGKRARYSCERTWRQRVSEGGRNTLKASEIKRG